VLSQLWLVQAIAAFLFLSGNQKKTVAHDPTRKPQPGYSIKHQGLSAQGGCCVYPEFVWDLGLTGVYCWTPSYHPIFDVRCGEVMVWGTPTMKLQITPKASWKKRPVSPW
jgi:hypothetical protein